MSTPVFSIIIPCFNDGVFIRDALQSVENCRDLVEWEIIIIDDGSTDQCTVAVLQQLAAESYCIVHQEHRGLSAARNNGIKRARGCYILPLDCDNKILSGYMSKSRAILDASPSVGVVYANAHFTGEKTGMWSMPPFDPQRLALSNFIDACSVFRRGVWEECGGYCEELPTHEDWDFWLSALEKGWDFWHIPEVLFEYRVRSDSLVRQSFYNKAFQKSFPHIIERHFDTFFPAYTELIVQQFRAPRRLFCRQQSSEFDTQEQCQH